MRNVRINDKWEGIVGDAVANYFNVIFQLSNFTGGKNSG
jgi:hypothetical protein